MRLSCDIKHCKEGFEAEVKSLDVKLIDIIRGSTILEVLMAFKELTDEQ
jgi:hypothetical protein